MFLVFQRKNFEQLSGNHFHVFSISNEEFWTAVIFSCGNMTSFAHQKNLCKWGWGRSEIRLAIINCKRRTDFAPTERPRCCGWIFSNYFFGTFRRPNCMARVTQNLKADTNTSLSLANWVLSLYFDKPMDHFTHPWWEFFSWAKLVMLRCKMYASHWAQTSIVQQSTTHYM